MTEPTTEAGRAMLAGLCECGGHDNDGDGANGHARWCAASRPQDILAIEAEARAEVTDDMTAAYMVGFEKGRAPLDVERLARALQRVIDNGDALALFREDAEDIAREYAALASEDRP